MSSPISRELPGDVKQILSGVEVVSLTSSKRSGKYIDVWDTGASMTMITPKVFDEYRIRIPYVFVAVSEIPDLDMLIGIDVIRQGEFLIKNLGTKHFFRLHILHESPSRNK